MLYEAARALTSRLPTMGVSDAGAKRVGRDFGSVRCGTEGDSDNMQMKETNVLKILKRNFYLSI